MSRAKKTENDNTINIKSLPIKNHAGASRYTNDDWGTIALLIPRSSLDIRFEEKELQHNCIYFLIGNRDFTWKAYVGQSKKRNSGGSVLKRLREHDKSLVEPYRNDWDYIVIVTNKEDIWGVDVLNALENAFYNELPVNKRLNRNTPNSAGAEFGSYLDKIEQIKAYISILGLDIFDSETDIKNTKSNTISNNYVVIEDLHNGSARIPEIVTPCHVVKQMVDALEQEDPDVWSPDKVFLDPACKGGEYLYEIYNRLMDSEAVKAKFPNDIARALHILQNQIYGIALSKTSYDRTVNKLNGFGQNIKVIPNYINLLKSKELGKRVDGTAITFQDKISEAFGKNMKFDVVIGNPPYQEATASIYHNFIKLAIELKPTYVSMIVKNNWMASDTLKNTREMMINSGLKSVINYPIVGEVFPSVGVAVCIFNIQLGYTGKTSIVEVQKGNITSNYECKLTGFNLIPINEIEYNIVSKVTQGMTDSFSTEIYPAECFRVNSNMTVGRGLNKYELDYSITRTEYYNVEVACMNGNTFDNVFINIEDVPARQEEVNKYKIICGEKISRGESVITNIKGLSPMSVCNGSWGLLYTSDSKEAAYNAYTYIKTRFFRFLVGIMCNGGMTGISPYRFSLVPNQDFSVEWSDTKLYEKYKLSDTEVDYINKKIKAIE